MTTPTPEDIKAQYGFVAMLAQAIPEVGSLMQRAVNEKWTADRFQMALASTNWWRTTDAANRQWVTQQYADPASATAALRNGGVATAALAAKLGFASNVFSAQEAEALWLESRLRGYDEAQTRARIVQYAAPRTAGLPLVGGEYGKWMTDMRQLASAYGYTGDVQKELANAGYWSGGIGDVDRFRQQMINYASSKFAPFAERIRAGETVQDIARPYIDVYAQTLEVNPQDVDLEDSHLQRWLQGASESGKPPVAVPVWQAKQELRKDTRWQYTRNAWESMADVAESIGRSFGMYG